MPSPQHITKLVFYVNGKKVVDDNPDPEMFLLPYLRTKLKLCGPKQGCGEGGCGACTVMLSKYDRVARRIRNYNINGCLFPVCGLHGMAITTVEGIGSTKTRLHPIQERIAKSHGSQCGFCTPGIVMSMYTCLRNHPEPSMEEMHEYIHGNLCRCTGYRPIVEGLKTLTKEGCCGGSNGNGCCKNGNTDNDRTGELFNPSEFLPYDPSQEPIFPAELQISNELDKQSLRFEGPRGVVWFRPNSLKELLELRTKHPNAVLVGGNTKIAWDVKFKDAEYPVRIALSAVPELISSSFDVRKGVTFGGAVPFVMVEEILKEIIEKEPEDKTRGYAAFVEMLRWYAGKQIKNVAAVAGNIVIAAPISDMNPLFLATGTEVNVITKCGKHRTVTINEKFFLGYRKTILKPDEILVSVTLPFTQKDEYIYGFKQAKRREEDLAVVNAGMWVKFVEGTNVVKAARLAYGQMARVPVMALKTAQGLVGRPWDDSILNDVTRNLAEDLPLDPNAPGGMVEYRRTLTTSFFFKFYLKVLLALEKNGIKVRPVQSSFRSACPPFRKDLPKASQLFQMVGPDQRVDDAVGRPLVHHNAFQQATGEAVYIDDIPKIDGELQLALVTSSRPHAKIVSIDPSPALTVKGVHGFVSAADLPGDNMTGALFKEEEIFATEIADCYGRLIGAVVADDRLTAQRAAKLVKVEYQDLPAVISIEDAIRTNSFYKEIIKTIVNGDVAVGFQQADHTIEGEIRTAGQEHFYLETHSVLVTPKGEHDEYEVCLSCQAPHHAHMVVSEAMGVPAHKITVRVKRCGGAFGGKEHNASMLTVPACVAAKKFNRPVRYMLDRHEDMFITGKRHPSLTKFKVGFSKEGKLTALEASIYLNAGRSIDFSVLVLELLMMKIDNGYKIPNVNLTGILCKTNLPSNAAMRGFGAPQAVWIVENILTEVAMFLNLDPLKVKEINLYKEGDLTHVNHKLESFTGRRCWDECLQQSDYDYRRTAVDQFNKENRWKKRGLAVSPMKYNCGFPLAFLNQGAALVNIYLDGSVLIAHGGVEMGQGLHTKVIQVASRALGISTSKIHISETNTDKTPNTIFTSGSTGADLYAGATLEACKTLLKRLESIIEAEPKGNWESWANAAFMNRISLSATGFYPQPCENFDFDKLTGAPAIYYSYGASVTEVEIDCLTGDQQILRTDIVFDVGDSLNPAIDIGQIEGGYMIGYGLYTLEELKYSPEGLLYSRGPTAYKIPGFGDIPTEFNVTLLKNAANPKAVYSSKAIGEPPLLLAVSAFCAIKAAIAAAREETGVKGRFRLDSPATPERIRLACKDRFVDQFAGQAQKATKPWNKLV